MRLSHISKTFLWNVYKNLVNFSLQIHVFSRNHGLKIGSKVINYTMKLYCSMHLNCNSFLALRRVKINCFSYLYSHNV